MFCFLVPAIVRKYSFAVDRNTIFGDFGWLWTTSISCNTPVIMRLMEESKGNMLNPIFKENVKEA